MGEAKEANPALQALIDLSNVDISPAQEQNLNLQADMDMLKASLGRPTWEHVRGESAEIKTLWCQYSNLKIPDQIVSYEDAIQIRGSSTSGNSDTTNVSYSHLLSLPSL